MSDHLPPDNDFTFIYECPKCRKQFKVRAEEQISGFRVKDILMCPYCGEIVQTSMEYEFFTWTN